MLKTCFAASILAVFALAVPVQAQSDTPYQLAQDDKACTAKGVGPETDGYSDCMAQRKVDRFQEVQRRAAYLAAAPHTYQEVGPTTGFDPQTGGLYMNAGPLGRDNAYLMPENTRAMQGTPDMPTQTITKVCVTTGDAAKPPAEGDAAKPQADSDAAKPQAICQTNVEVKVKAAPRHDYRDDPTSPLARSYEHPGDIFHDRPIFGGGDY